MDRVDDRVDADKTRDLQRGEVQGFTQRLAHGERAVLLLRRVLRAVALASAIGHVELDVVELGRRRHPQLEHARQVGEELERRPRLTEGDAGVVVVALYLRGVHVVVVAPDVREDLAGRRIHRDEGGIVDVVALEGVDVLAYLFLGKLLHVPVERGVHVVPAAIGRFLAEDLHELLADPEREVGRVQGRRHGLHDDLLGLRRLGLRRRRVAVVDHGVEHEGAARFRAFHVLDRVVVRRRLGKAGEQRHLPEGQLVQVGDAEVRGRGCLQSIGLVPVIDLVEVHLEDLGLAERPRRLDREDRFFDLARERRVVTEEARLDQLLRDRRAALRNASARAVDLDRADDATDVDAGVGPKGLVLDRDRRVLHPFGNGIDRDQIASFIRERVEQVLPASVVDVSGEGHRHRGEVARGGKIRGEVAERRGRGDADEREAGEEDGREDARERADRPHRADAARKAAARTGRKTIGTVSPARSDPLDGHLAV